MLHQASLVEPPVFASSEYGVQRALETAAEAARLGLFASSTGNAEPSLLLACRQIIASAGVREPAAPMSTSSTTDYRGSSYAATSGLHFKIQCKECHSKRYQSKFQTFLIFV